MFYKFLIIIITISLSSCNNSYLDSIIDLDYLSTKQILTFEEKGLYYPSWNISIRRLQNKSTKRNFTAEEKEITLRIMSIIRFVLNTPEYEANILKQTMKASRNAYSRTTSETIKIGERLYPKRVLRTVQKAVIETEIALSDLDPFILGQAIVTSIYLYLEDTNHNAYPSIIKQLNNLVWIEFTSQYTIKDSLHSYAEIENTILHESVHNMGFSHHNNIPTSVDVAYVIGNMYAETLRDINFLKKYEDEFKKIIPYYEEKYHWFIKDEPSARTTRNAASRTFNTHSPDGETLTVVECIIENPENYIKPFRYVVKDGQRTNDNFILK